MVGGIRPPKFPVKINYFYILVVVMLCLEGLARDYSPKLPFHSLTSTRFQSNDSLKTLYFGEEPVMILRTECLPDVT